MFGGNFAPAGWAFCNGALLAISENETLFNLIGTTYGGDGQSTFALPNLQSRIPMHQGSNPANGNTYSLAQTAGQETVQLTLSQIATHNHVARGSSLGATSRDPAGKVWAAWNSRQFSDQAQDGPMAAGASGSTGGQPHDNMVPFLAINFIISLFGVFPSPT